MKVLVGMSGGVDSSVATYLLLQEGHEVIGATMKLWDGETESGCCSLADVEDARRVAAQLNIPHYIFSFVDEFTRDVVEPYVQSHAEGHTPNPCISCNRTIKFDLLLRRARQLGCDAVATGHYARLESGPDGRELWRARDQSKDQSYVLHLINEDVRNHLLLPLGNLTKPEVRALGLEIGLRTAEKPDSQDVCFINKGRKAFLGDRIPLHSGRLRDATTGAVVGEVVDVELFTTGQRKGIGGGAGERRYVVSVDVPSREVLVGGADQLLITSISIAPAVFLGKPLQDGEEVLAQASAHGKPFLVRYRESHVECLEPQRKVAPGQSLVFYSGDQVLGGAVVQ